MSYSERDGQVILTMSRYDYAFLRRMLGNAMAEESGIGLKSSTEFLNRLNSGNPNYTPYQIVSDKITQPWVRREDLHSRCCDAPVMVGDDDVCSKCGRPCSHRPYQG